MLDLRSREPLDLQFVRLTNQQPVFFVRWDVEGFAPVVAKVSCLAVELVRCFPLSRARPGTLWALRWGFRRGVPLQRCERYRGTRLLDFNLSK